MGDCIPGLIQVGGPLGLAMGGAMFTWAGGPPCRQSHSSPLGLHPYKLRHGYQAELLRHFSGVGSASHQIRLWNCATSLEIAQISMPRVSATSCTKVYASRTLKISKNFLRRQRFVFSLWVEIAVFQSILPKLEQFHWHDTGNTFFFRFALLDEGQNFFSIFFICKQYKRQTVSRGNLKSHDDMRRAVTRRRAIRGHQFSGSQWIRNGSRPLSSAFPPPTSRYRDTTVRLGLPIWQFHSETIKAELRVQKKYQTFMNTFLQRIEIHIVRTKCLHRPRYCLVTK